MNPSPENIHPGWNKLTELLRRIFLTRRQFLPVAGAAALLPSALCRSVFARAQACRRARRSGQLAIHQQDQACGDPRTGEPFLRPLFRRDRARSSAWRPIRRADSIQGWQFPTGAGKQKICALSFDAILRRGPRSQLGRQPHQMERRRDEWLVVEESGSNRALGYFLPEDHIYHLQLAQAFEIADHNFCSMIGPTLPNRLYLWSGTSGWNYLRPHRPRIICRITIRRSPPRRPC